MGYLQFKLNFWVTLIAWNLRFTLIEDKLIFWGDSLKELPCLRIHLFEDRFEFYFVWGQICLGIDLIFTLFEDNLSPASLHAQPPLCKVPSLGKVEHSDVSGCFLCYLLQWPSKGEAGRNKNADCEKYPKHFRLKSFVSKVLPQNLCLKSFLNSLCRWEWALKVLLLPFIRVHFEMCLTAGVTKVKTQRVDISVFIMHTSSSSQPFITENVLCGRWILWDISRPVVFHLWPFWGILSMNDFTRK